MSASTYLYLGGSDLALLAYAVSQIKTDKATTSLHRNTILLPTAGTIHDLRRQMGDTMGVEMVQFYRLARAILDQAAIPIHELNDASIRRLIKKILTDMATDGTLSTFLKVSHKPGFIDVILEWLREMKSQGIFPEDYAAYAEQSGLERDRQLATFYLRYQAFMQEGNYSDTDGLLWLAAEALENDPTLYSSKGSCFVLGFDQFSPVQVRILRQLTKRFENFAIYLLWDSERSEDSLALSRLRETRAVLESAIPLEVRTLEEKGDPETSLFHVSQTLFEADAEKIESTDQIQAIEAPSREAEVRWALREIKRLLLKGVPYHEIALLTPNPNAYTPLVRTVSKEYNVPVETKRFLSNEPVVTALKNVLQLSPNFPWRETFDVLRSSYFQKPWLTSEQINLLDQLTRERPVIAGVEQWAFALTPLKLEAEDPEDEDRRSPPLVAQLPTEALGEIQTGLNTFFDHVSPPKTATYRDYTWWIQTTLLGFFPLAEGSGEAPPSDIPTLNLIAQAQEGAFPQRDQRVINLVLRAMRSLMASAETVPDGDQVAWDTYREELLSLLEGVRLASDPAEARVRFAHLADGRARSADYLFVLGLSEGEFPSPPKPDMLYANHERENHPLPLRHSTSADDASLWWQVVNNCKRRLIMLRPYIDANGAPWQASPYWDAVLAPVKNPKVEKIPLAYSPNPAQTASPSELLIALSKTNAQTVPNALESLWKRTKQVNGVMKQRASYQAPGVYEGIIQTKALQREFEERFGDRHTWSASRLNRYANCPYGFFAQYGLKLESRIEPEEGLDALQRGSVLHAVLEQFNLRIAENNLLLTTGHLDELRKHLAQSCQLIFSDAPQRYGFRPGALWKYEQNEFKRMLDVLIRWECEENGRKARFAPYLAEAGFGIGTGPPSLEINTEQLSFRLHGLIDRIDIDADGNLRVIDYKSGSSRYWKSDLRKGLALQTALYAYAAETFWTEDDSRVVESYYLHIPIRKASGKLKFENQVRQDALAETVINQAAESVANARLGIFPSAPAGGMACRRWCDFASLCRVSRQSIAKAPGGELT